MLKFLRSLLTCYDHKATHSTHNKQHTAPTTSNTQLTNKKQPAKGFLFLKV